MVYRRRRPTQMQAATESVAVAPTAPVARPAKPRARMMRQYDLVERVRSYNPNTNEDLLNRAYVYAMKAHGSQTRASGDPYFSHPLEVAAILTDLKLDDDKYRLGSRDDDPQFFLNDRLFEPRPFGPKDRAEVDSRGRGIVLTDDYAPVENLLAPVAETRGDDD